MVEVVKQAVRLRVGKTATLRSLFTSFTHGSVSLGLGVMQDALGYRGARVMGFCIECGLGDMC
jgi:hypothetical protein